MKTSDVFGYKEVEVFENQRIRPLFGWGSAGYLFPMDPFPFSDESGAVNCDTELLQDIRPPAGFEWANEWVLSLNHTSTDDEGWSYASSFSRLATRLKNNTSSKERAVHHVTRRRLWRRLARPSRAANAASAHLAQDRSREQRAHAGFCAAPLLSGGLSPADGDFFVRAMVVQNEKYVDGHGWSADHLDKDCGDWSPFSDVTGKHALPPPSTVRVKWGYEWTEDWHVDYRCQATDERGFIYGISCSDMRSLLTLKQDPEATVDAGNGVVSVRTVADSSSRDRSQKYRSRLWMRTMMKCSRQSTESNRLDRPLRACYPFELRLRVVEASGLLAGGQIRAEVLVDGLIMGLTDSQSIQCHKQAFGMSGINEVEVSTGVARWLDESIISVPLTSMAAHSIQVNLYRESHENRKCTTVVGSSQRDKLLEGLWSQVNRNVRIRFPLDNVVGASGGERMLLGERGDERHVLVDAMLVERGTVHVKPQISISEEPTTSAGVAGGSLPYDTAAAYVTALLEKECMRSQRSNGVATELAKLAVQDLTKSKYRLPTLLLTPNIIADICTDIHSPTFESSGDCAHWNGPSLFNFSTSMDSESSLRVTKWGFAPAQVQVGSPRSALSFSNIPVTRRLQDVVLHSVKKRDRFSYYQFDVLIGDHSFSFHVVDEYKFLQVMRAIGKCRSGIASSAECLCDMHTESADPVPVTLNISAGEDSRSSAKLTWTPRPPASRVPAAVECAEFSCEVENSTIIRISSSFSFAHTFVLNIHLWSVAFADLLPGSSLAVSITTEDGQCSCVESVYPSAAYPVLRLYLTAADILNSRRLRLGLHVCASRSTAGARTLGECLVLTGDLIGNSLNAGSSSTAASELGVYVNVPTVRSLRMQSPRHAIIFKFIRGEGLLAVDLGGTSDPYCILKFVDHMGAPVSSKSYRTKISKMTLNPTWNEQVVFDSDYGFLQATYAHIEIWDRDIVTANSCLGEVHIPLLEVSEQYVEKAYAVQWSVSMPHSSSSKHSGLKSLGTIFIGCKVVHKPSAQREQITGELVVCSSIERTSASSAMWMCRPLTAAAQKKAIVFEDLFCCTTARGQPGLILQHASRIGGCRWGQAESGDCNSDTARMTMKEGKPATAKPKQRGIIEKRPEERMSDILLQCQEARKDGLICIPWSQVFEVDAVSDSSVVITFSIHRRFSAKASAAIKSNTIVFREATVEILVGPCPAQSVMMLVKESIDLEYLRVDPHTSVQACSVDVESRVDVSKARSLFLDVAEALWECQAIIGCLMEECPFPDNSQNMRRDSYYNESCLLPCCEICPSPASGASVHIAYEVWSSVLARRAYLCLFMRRLAYHCSDPQQDNTLSESSVLQLINRHNKEFAGSESLYLRQADEPSFISGDDSSGYIDAVKTFLSSIEDSLLDAVICGWALYHDSPVRAANQDRVVLGHDKQPRIVCALNSLVVGYYNRMISLIGAQVDQKNFELLPGNQAKLDLITFVISNDDRLSEFIKVVLNALGLEVEPLPKLSLALNIEDLLGRYAAALSSELDLYLSRVLSSNSSGESECNLIFGDDNSVTFEPPSWGIDMVKDRVIIGPAPELVHTIALTFLHLSKAPRAELSVESRKRVYRMNAIIAQSVLTSHLRLVENFEGVLGELNELLNLLFDRKAELHLDSALTDMISFICSIANDCARMSSDYLPQVMSEARFLLGAGEEGRNEGDAALVRDSLQSLDGLADRIKSDMMYLSWTAVELLTKVIYLDLEEEYVVKFEGLWSESAEAESTVQVILRTLLDYCCDFFIYLTPENYHLLMLSCGHKLVQRYLQMLYDHSRGERRVNGISTKTVMFPIAKDVIRRRKGTARSPFGSSAIADDFLELHPLANVSLQQTREDLLRMVTEFAKVLDAPFHRSHICPMFHQLNVFIDAIESPVDTPEFQEAIREVSALSAQNEEAVLCALVLKGLDIHMAKQMSSSVCAGAEERRGMEQWWELCALRSTFEEPSPASMGGATDKRTGGKSLLFDVITAAEEQKEKAWGHSSIKRLMGLSGPLRGLNDRSAILAMTEPLSTRKRAVLVKISQLQCRGLTAAQFGIGRNWVYLSVKCGQEKSTTAFVLSAMSPKWDCALSFCTTEEELNKKPILIELIEYNRLFVRYTPLAGCERAVSHLIAGGVLSLNEWVPLYRKDLARSIRRGIINIGSGLAASGVDSGELEGSTVNAERLSELELMLHLKVEITHT